MVNKEFFIKFNCPNYTDHMVVLKMIQKMLLEYKCEMTECGETAQLEKIVFRKATGAVTGKAVPPKYRKNISDECRP
jgi:hypothetical protein